MAETYIYSTASNVAAFINGFHIEQAYGFNYKESIPKVPIYGYNDYEFSKVVRGKGIVQGIFVINFTFPGYLTSVLTTRQDVYVPKLYNYQFGLNASTEQQHQEKIFRELRTELPANTSEQSKRARAEYIASLISSKDKNNKDSTKQALYDLFGIRPGLESKSAFDFAGNLITAASPLKNTKTVQSPLIADSNSTVGNQIDIYYQDPELLNWFVRFNNVHFTEVSQNISQAGAEGSSEPLYEIYEFIAQNREIKLISKDNTTKFNRS